MYMPYEARFPNRRIPEDENTRAELCDELEMELRKIDKAFSDASAEVRDCLKEYIDANGDEFAQQATEFWRKYA